MIPRRIVHVSRETGSTSSTPRQPGTNIETDVHGLRGHHSADEKPVRAERNAEGRAGFGADVEGVDVLEEHQKQQQEIARLEGVVVHLGGQEVEDREAHETHVEARDQAPPRSSAG